MAAPSCVQNPHAGVDRSSARRINANAHDRFITHPQKTVILLEVEVPGVIIAHLMIDLLKLRKQVSHEHQGRVIFFAGIHPGGALDSDTKQLPTCNPLTNHSLILGLSAVIAY